YSLPEKLIAEVGLTRARVYVNGNNLFTFSKFKDFGLGDPEVFNALNLYYQPAFRTITAGLNISF
ncbi:MAG: hypothetical protein AAFX53_14210, partial [Bacteroidota bacterium]